MNLLLALALSLQEEGSAFEAALRARITDLGGDAGEGLEYSDFFRTGSGASLQVSWMLDPERHSLGFWSSLAFDRFGGDGFSDDLGDRVSAEALDRFLLLAGPRVRFMFKEPIFRGNSIFLDVRGGAGAAWYDSVEGVFQTGGVTRKGLEIFDAGVQPAGEAALSTGVASRTFSFGFGLAFRWIGGPDRGADASTVVDPGVWTDVSFEFGLEYRF